MAKTGPAGVWPTRGSAPVWKGGSGGPPAVRRVTKAGTFRLKHKLLFMANSLTHHHGGLKETDDGIGSISFNTALPAKQDDRDFVIRG